jgi:outer membrane biosynthesis protein TonB
MRQTQPRSYLATSLSIALHLSVLAAGLVAWPWLKPPPKVLAITPVTVISTGPITDVSAALQAEAVVQAATEKPDLDAPAQAQPPLPIPRPMPVPTALPRPDPVPVAALKPLPIPQPFLSPSPRPVPPRPAPSLDLEALASRIRPAAPPQPSRPSSAAPGPSHSQTDLVMRPAVGPGRASTVDVLQAISARLARLWNPNCGVEGAANIVVKVRLTLAPGGRLIRANLIDEQRILQSGDGVLQAAGTRALTAVARAAPYAELPAETYADWRSFVVSFDARQICRGY